MRVLGVLIELRSLRSFLVDSGLKELWEFLGVLESFESFLGVLGVFESFWEYFKSFVESEREFFSDFTPCLFYRVSLIRTVETNQSCETYHLIDGPEANTCKGAFDSLS